MLRYIALKMRAAMEALCWYLVRISRFVLDPYHAENRRDEEEEERPYWVDCPFRGLGIDSFG